MERPKIVWSENVILVDAAFLDALVQDFAQHFSSRIGRPLGKLDLCHWLDCLLLDAGLEEGAHDNFVAFLHAPGSRELQFVAPGRYREDLSGKAFKDRLGEFTLGSFTVEEMVSTGRFMTEALKAAQESEGTRRILVVADFAAYGPELCRVAGKDTRAQVTLFGMSPLPPGKYTTQVLGYSVMSGLGIKGEEL